MLVNGSLYKDYDFSYLQNNDIIYDLTPVDTPFGSCIRVYDKNVKGGLYEWESRFVIRSRIGSNDFHVQTCRGFMTDAWVIKPLHGLYSEWLKTGGAPIKGMEIIGFDESWKDYSLLKDLDLTNITMLSYAFANHKNLTNLEFMKNWDTSHIERFNGVFMRCVNLEDVSHLECLNLSEVVNMNNLFLGCSTLKCIDLRLNTPNLHTADSLFSGCVRLRFAYLLNSKPKYLQKPCCLADDADYLKEIDPHLR